MSVVIFLFYAFIQVPLLSMACDDTEKPWCTGGEPHIEHHRGARYFLVKMDVQSKIEHTCVTRCKDLPGSPNLSWQKCCVYASSWSHQPRNKPKQWSPSFCCVRHLLWTVSWKQVFHVKCLQIWQMNVPITLPYFSSSVSYTSPVLVAASSHRLWSAVFLGCQKAGLCHVGCCTGTAFHLPEAPTAAGALTDLSVFSHC